MLDASIADAGEALAPSESIPIPTIPYVEADRPTAGQEAAEGKSGGSRQEKDSKAGDSSDTAVRLLPARGDGKAVLGTVPAGKGDSKELVTRPLESKTPSADVGFVLDLTASPARQVPGRGPTIEVDLPEGEVFIGTLSFLSGKGGSFGLADPAKAARDGFVLDPKSGRLGFVAPKNYHAAPRVFTVDIAARDGDAEPKNHRIVVRITDVDQAPMWQMAPDGGALHDLTTSVTSSDRGYVLAEGVTGRIGRLRALDPEGATPRYDWHRDSRAMASRMGIILSVDGTVSVDGTIARPAFTRFTLTAIATDPKGHAGSGLSWGFVVPEGAEISLRPALGARLDAGVVHINEGQAAIGQLKAAAARPVVWSLVPGKDAAHFDLKDGFLFLRSPPRFDTPAQSAAHGRYGVTVAARIGGIIQEKTFIVAIDYVNKPPRSLFLDIEGSSGFRTEGGVILIPRAGARIGVLKANDPEGGGLRFGFVDPARAARWKVSLDSGSGEMSFAGVSDSALIESLVVYAEDSSGERTQISLAFRTYGGPSLQGLKIEAAQGVKYETRPYHLSLTAPREDRSILRLSLPDSSTRVSFGLAAASPDTNRANANRDRFDLADGTLILKTSTSREAQTLRVTLEARQGSGVSPIPLVIELLAPLAPLAPLGSDVRDRPKVSQESKPVLRIVAIAGEGSGDRFRIPENTGAALRIHAPGKSAEDLRIEGADRDVFSLEEHGRPVKDGGILSFKTPPDFEKDRAADSSRTYRIRIEVDRDGETISRPLTITVYDVPEAVTPAPPAVKAAPPPIREASPPKEADDGDDPGAEDRPAAPPVVKAAPTPIRAASPPKEADDGDDPEAEDRPAAPPAVVKAAPTPIRAASPPKEADDGDDSGAEDRPATPPTVVREVPTPIRQTSPPKEADDGDDPGAEDRPAAPPTVVREVPTPIRQTSPPKEADDGDDPGAEDRPATPPTVVREVPTPIRQTSPPKEADDGDDSGAEDRPATPPVVMREVPTPIRQTSPPKEADDGDDSGAEDRPATPPAVVREVPTPIRQTSPPKEVDDGDDPGAEDRPATPPAVVREVPTPIREASPPKEADDGDDSGAEDRPAAPPVVMREVPTPIRQTSPPKEADAGDDPGAEDRPAAPAVVKAAPPPIREASPPKEADKGDDPGADSGSGRASPPPYTRPPGTSLGHFLTYRRHGGVSSTPSDHEEREEKGEGRSIPGGDRSPEFRGTGARLDRSRSSAENAIDSPMKGWSSVRVDRPRIGEDGVVRARLFLEAGKKVHLLVKPLMDQLRSNVGLDPDPAVSVNHQGKGLPWLEYRLEDGTLAGEVPESIPAGYMSFNVRGQSGREDRVALEFAPG